MSKAKQTNASGTADDRKARQARAARDVLAAVKLLGRAIETLDGESFGDAIAERANDLNQIGERLKQYSEHGWS